jgi:hypothetical protein
MAFGQKYVLRFSDIKPDCDNWELDIYIDNYTGTQIYPLSAHSPIIHNLLGTDDLKFGGIKGSTLDVSLVIQEDQETYYDDFAYIGEKSMYGLLKKDGVNYWRGWLVRDPVSRPLLPPPYILDLTFSDYLGKLKEVPFEKTNGALYYGRMTVLQVIYICINKIGFQLDLHEAFDIYEDEMDDILVTDSSLAQIYLDLEMFLDGYEPKNCYEVLQMCTFGCRVWQENCIWWIVPTNLMKTEYTYRKFTHSFLEYIYTSNGTRNDVITINHARSPVADRNVFINNTGYKELGRGYRSVKLTQTFKSLSSGFIWNSDLKEWVGNTPASFSRGSQASFTKNDDNTINYPIKIMKNSLDYIKYEFYIRETDTINTIKIDIDYNYVDLPATHVFFELDLKVGGAWLNQDSNWQVMYSPLSDDIIAMNESGTSTFTITSVTGFSGAGILRIYAPYMWEEEVNPNTSKFTINNIQLTLVSGNNIDNYLDKDYEEVINNKNTNQLPYDLILGDFPYNFPDLINCEYLFKYGLFTGAGTPLSWYYRTHLWYIQEEGSGSLRPLAEILLQRLIELYNFYDFVLTGELLGHLTPGMVIKDRDGNIYIVADYSHNLRTSIFDCRLIQIALAPTLFMEWESGSNQWIEWESAESGASFIEQT